MILLFNSSVKKGSVKFYSKGPINYENFYYGCSNSTYQGETTSKVLLLTSMRKNQIKRVGPEEPTCIGCKFSPWTAPLMDVHALR